jgi:hypothetical protein
VLDCAQLLNLALLNGNNLNIDLGSLTSLLNDLDLPLSLPSIALPSIALPGVALPTAVVAVSTSLALSTAVAVSTGVAVSTSVLGVSA